jgi:hypothetical protein
MAAVTEISPPLVTDIGSQIMIQQTITVVTTGDKWTPGLRSITSCGVNDTTSITKMAPDTANPPALVMTGTGASLLAWAIGYP